MKQVLLYNINFISFTKSPKQTENKGIIKMSRSAKNVYSQVLICLFLAESPFLQLFSSSELLRHLTSGGSGSVSESGPV